jgi:multicomponent Na+:H+ antiporter subunit F
VSTYLVGAAVLLVGLAPMMVFAVRAKPADGLVALNVGGTIATIVLVLLSAGTDREPFFDLAVVSAILSFAGGLGYARFLERWL